MREILFRGKRKDNGEWIEGYLVKLGRESFSDPERYGICKKAIHIGGSGVCYNLKIDEVIPETIGQYTDLTDKNGKKIFGGDIVKLDGTEISQIRYCEGVYRLCNGDGYYGVSVHNHHSYVEVIGNIHDNHELLKGG